MTKRHFSTKQSLIASILVLAMCFSALIGTTFAWFTDAVTSANNIIKTGRLDIKAEYTLDGESWNDLDGADDLFQIDLWEPGHTEVVALRISNAGSLNLKYLAKLNLVRELIGKTKDGKDIVLSDILTVSTFMMSESDAAAATVARAFESENGIEYESTASFNNTNILGAEKTLAPEEIQYLIVKVDMAESVGNEANHDGTNIPTIEFGINVLATQYTAENDSFGNDYDKFSVYPDGAYRIPADKDLTATGAAGEELLIKNANDSFAVKATAGAEGTVKSEITTTGPSEKAFVIADASNLNLVSYDIKVVGQEDNSPVEITLYLGKSLSGVSVYHNGEKLSTNDYSYDPITGYLTFTTAEFSTFDITFGEEAEIFSSYDEIAAAKGTSGVYVLSDGVVVSDKIYFGDNTANTIDLNGKTVTTESAYVFATQGANCNLTINGNGTVTTNTGYAAFANKGSTLTINGGTYQLGEISQAAHFYSQNSATLVINDGNFISSDKDTPILYCINGFIEINGGFFQNTANPNAALLSMGNNLKYANNQKITLSGGTFVNWNPMNSAFARPWTNPDVPALIVLADGYEILSETQENGDVWYTVVPVSDAE